MFRPLVFLCLYLQDPVVRLKSSSVCRPFRSDHVDVNSLFQEAVRHAEAKVIVLWVFDHGHLQG